MKFSTRVDIEAPVDFVFEKATDFESYERQALQRGIEIVRVDTLGEKAVGMCWEATVSFRGKSRDIKATLAVLDAPNTMLISSVSSGVKIDFDLEFIQLSRDRTRVKVGLDLTPKTLSSRLLIQSLKFAKSGLNKRFEKRVASFGRGIEESYHYNGKTVS